MSDRFESFSFFFVVILLLRVRVSLGIVEVVVVVAEDIDSTAVCCSISVDSLGLSRVVLVDRTDSESWKEEVEFDLLLLVDRTDSESWTEVAAEEVVDPLLI